MTVKLAGGGAVAGGVSTNGAAYPVLIIDDHELFSSFTTMALRSKGLDARTLAVSCVPDFLHQPTVAPTGLVLLDLDLGRDDDDRSVDGVDLVEGLRARGWKVLVVSGSVDQTGVAAAIAAGAIGSVPKSGSFDALLKAISTAAMDAPLMTESEHGKWLERHRQDRAEQRELFRRLARLSPRERDVLELLAEGMRASAIAQHFVVSMPTVRSQIRSILTKLDVRSQLEAVALFRQRSGPNGTIPAVLRGRASVSG
jgi:DNA-binding NarL/FixJ family response regulator